MSGFQRLSLITALATYALIVIGGVVRASEAGLGCPDWPLCHGQATPLPQREVIIEYSHRAAALVVSLLVVATAVLAWRRYRGLPSLWAPSMLALGLLVAQVLVGGVTVLLELPAEIVALHLALAIMLLASLTVATVASWASRPGASLVAGNGSGLFGFAIVAAAATFGLIVTGAYVTGSDAGLVFTDWPLFNGQVIAEGGRLQQIHFLHRLAAAGVGLLLAFLAVSAWRQHRRSFLLMAPVAVALVLYLAQVMVGASNIWFRLDPVVRVAHLALAVALWTTLVALAAVSFRYGQQLAKAVAAPLGEQPGGIGWR